MRPLSNVVYYFILGALVNRDARPQMVAKLKQGAHQLVCVRFARPTGVSPEELRRRLQDAQQRRAAAAAAVLGAREAEAACARAAAAAKAARAAARAATLEGQRRRAQEAAVATAGPDAVAVPTDPGAGVSPDADEAAGTGLANDSDSEWQPTAKAAAKAPVARRPVIRRPAQAAPAPAGGLAAGQA